MKKITFALTGATGLLGGNLLLEIIKQNYKKLSDIEIYILGRSKGDNSLSERIYKSLSEELLDYIDDNNLILSDILNELSNIIKFVDIKLDQPHLEIDQDDYKLLSSKPIDFFFHIAALTNLWHDDESKKKLEEVNIGGTRNIINLVSNLGNVGELIYVGTAYSCGKNYGNIKPDFINHSHIFRNNYERTKHDSEMLVREFEKKSGQRCRYYRPSVVCGRMIEKELGSVSKFDVFYGWALFFLQIKKKMVFDMSEIISKKCFIDIRYKISFDSGLNIVPSDYCAKVMYYACVNDYPERHIHLVNNNEIPHSYYFPFILKSINVEGAKPVSEIPLDQNNYEKLYYKSAGKIYNEYINSEPMNFDNSNISDINKKFIIPDLTKEENFLILLEHANKKKYGIN